MSSSQAVYLDHAATTPLLPEVLAAMTGQLGRVGNASSLHASGRAAPRVAGQSRGRLGGAPGARPSAAPFTGGGTARGNPRSAQHTSEPQSRQYLVCRLLL